MRRHPRAFAAKLWRAGRGAGPSPGVWSVEYRFDEGLTPRANGWPASSGRRAVAVLSPNPISLRRVGRVCEPCPECGRVSPSTLRRRPETSSARRNFTPAPVPSAPAAARSQALRALQATRPGVIIGGAETPARKSGREKRNQLKSSDFDQRHCDSWSAEVGAADACSSHLYRPAAPSQTVDR